MPRRLARIRVAVLRTRDSELGGAFLLRRRRSLARGDVERAAARARVAGAVDFEAVAVVGRHGRARARLPGRALGRTRQCAVEVVHIVAITARSVAIEDRARDGGGGVVDVNSSALRASVLRLGIVAREGEVGAL